MNIPRLAIYLFNILNLKPTTCDNFFESNFSESNNYFSVDLNSEDNYFSVDIACQEIDQND